jgi:hypothetical protein
MRLLAFLLLLASPALAQTSVTVGGQRINGYCVAALVDAIYEPSPALAARTRSGAIPLDECQTVDWRWIGQACDTRTCVGLERSDEVGRLELTGLTTLRGVTPVLVSASAEGASTSTVLVGLALSERTIDQRRRWVLERRWQTEVGSRCHGGIDSTSMDAGAVLEVRGITPLALMRLAAPDATGIGPQSFEDCAVCCGASITRRLDPVTGTGGISAVSLDSAVLLDPPADQPQAQCLARVLRAEPPPPRFDLPALRALGQRFLRACPAG